MSPLPLAGASWLEHTAFFSAYMGCVFLPVGWALLWFATEFGGRSRLLFLFRRLRSLFTSPQQRCAFSLSRALVVTRFKLGLRRLASWWLCDWEHVRSKVTLWCFVVVVDELVWRAPCSKGYSLADSPDFWLKSWKLKRVYVKSRQPLELQFITVLVI